MKVKENFTQKKQKERKRERERKSEASCRLVARDLAQIFPFQYGFEYGFEYGFTLDIRESHADENIQVIYINGPFACDAFCSSLQLLGKLQSQ